MVPNTYFVVYGVSVCVQKKRMRSQQEATRNIRFDYLCDDSRESHWQHSFKITDLDIPTKSDVMMM